MAGQEIEHPRAVELWRDLCDEIQRECRGVNSVEGQRMVVERRPLHISVTDTNTRKLLRLSYHESGPLINCHETGKPDASITFRAEHPSAASPALIYRGIPQPAQALAVNLMIGLSRF
jgi:hypothetical protein